MNLKQVIDDTQIDFYNESYRAQFERESVCCRKEMNALYVHHLDRGNTLGHMLELMQSRVGQPSFRGDSKSWPSMEELPTVA